jgi:hypothetical protein
MPGCDERSRRPGAERTISASWAEVQGRLNELAENAGSDEEKRRIFHDLCVVLDEHLYLAEWRRGPLGLGKCGSMARSAARSLGAASADG